MPLRGEDNLPMTVQPHELPAGRPLGDLEPVAHFDGPMLTGVTVSHGGRIFVNFPKWGDDVEFTVAEVRDGREVPFPNADINRVESKDQADKLVSVQSVVVDPADRLWILDTGSPLFEPTEYGGPKLVCVDLETDEVVKTILLPQDVALPTTYLNDVRFDLRRSDEGVAFITDSSDRGPNGIIMVDLASGESWRRLHDHPTTKAEQPPDFLPVVEGRPVMERNPDGSTNPITMGSDGIAIGADGSRLYYCKLMGRQLYSVSTDALCDRSLGDGEVARTVIHEGDKGGAGDGMETAWRRTRRATSTRRTSSTTPFCAVFLAESGRRWRTIRACYGLTPCRSRRTATSISRRTSCIVRLSTRAAKTSGKSPTLSSASTSEKNLSC